MSRDLEFDGWWTGEAVYTCDCPGCVKEASFRFDSEAENEQVSIHIRGNKQLKNIPLDKFIEMCTTMNEEHSLDIIDTL